MAKLLISVRNVAEACEALRGGADWLDIKEPAAGPLGPAHPAVWQQIANSVDRAVPCSVALGELADERQLLEAIPPRFSFAKVGLAGMAGCDWYARWREVRRRLAPTAELVAVVYADWQTAHAPPPDEILCAVQQAGGRAVLFDTYNKEYSIFACVAPQLLAQWIDRVQRAGMLAVLAGSIKEASLGTAVALGPDLVAIRGAACDGGRLGHISAARVARLAQRIREARVSPAAVSVNSECSKRC